MELEKQGNSDGSSGQESDRVYQDMAGTAKRSYGCTFCKRGFTNAQALGGHMNIHRKDRAKAKQPSSSSVRNDHQLMDQDHHMNPSYLPPISPTQVPTKYYPVLEDQRMNNNNNYHMYFQPPLLSSLMLSYGHVYDRSKFVVAGGSQSLSINEEVLGANLSLQVGPAGRDSDRVRRGIMEQMKWIWSFVSVTIHS